MITDKKSRLVFHFYVPENWRDYEMVKYHIKLLKHYSSCFTDIVFVLAFDDINNKKLITEFELVLLDCNFNCNITFKAVENTYLYESKTLYDEIVSKLDKLDGITFFGHSKGIGNEKFQNTDIEKIKEWVCALYYFSLEDIYDVYSNLYGVWGITYGPLKVTYETIDNKNHWMYSGTFYWINCQRLYDRVKRYDIELRHCTDRFFSELWLGDAIPLWNGCNKPNIASSYNEAFLINATNFYDDIDSYIHLVAKPEIYEDFMRLKNEIDNEEFN